jgi:hypothetical protein
MKRYCPALTRVIEVSSLSLAIVTSGAFGLNGLPFGCALGSAKAPVSNRNFTVLSAAPRSSTCLDLNVQPIQEYSPPAYVRTFPANIHVWQLSPSKDWGAPGPKNAPLTEVVDSGGTLGARSPKLITVWAKTGCAVIDVWDPNKYMQQTPNANDPNASVTLDITPPSSPKSRCTIWKWHGEAAPANGESTRRGGKRKNYTPAPSRTVIKTLPFLAL